MSVPDFLEKGNKKDVYRYWALLDSTEEGVSVSFPDLPGCVTFGETAEEAHAEAREALEGFMYELETDGDPIPNPSLLETILKQADPGEAAIEVQVDMPVVREAMGS
ncbi:type II toxin-antitoxin system HicB family antitoxin [Saccharibacillus brassicae]